jgi:predicted aconitase
VIVPVPPATVNTCHIQGGLDPELWAEQGMTMEAFEHAARDDAETERRGVKLLKTCTPHLAGIAPKLGEHCVWMESSAVIFCNSVLGARTNIEGKESTSAAMLTGKIPYFGLHDPCNRAATHLVTSDVAIDTMMDWGLFGYFVGGLMEDGVPAIDGIVAKPDFHCHKHFGAAMASAGEAELYHIIGHTPEAPTLKQILRSCAPQLVRYTQRDRRAAYATLNSHGIDTNVDFVMLGCPHYSIEQIAQVASLLEGKKVHSCCRLWIFASRAAKVLADTAGYAETIKRAGAFLMTDICSAVARAVPKDARVAALDSAKQAHYLPIITGLQTWFGSTDDCVKAAITGRWAGVAP